LFASGLTMNDVTVITQGTPTMNLVNVNGSEISGVKGNNETWLMVDGKESEGIVVRSADPEQARQMTSLGEMTPDSAVDYKAL